MNDQQRAAMQMALEALIANLRGTSGRFPLTNEAITALREALAQPTPQEITVFEGYVSSAQTEALQKALAQPQGEPKCVVCGTTENLHKDNWHGYRCDSEQCVCY